MTDASETLKKDPAKLRALAQAAQSEADRIDPPKPEPMTRAQWKALSPSEQDEALRVAESGHTAAERNEARQAAGLSE